MSRVNETIVQHDSCRLNGNVIEVSFKDDYMWNPSTYDCECDKSYKIVEYLDIKNCSCKKRLFNELVLACEN